MSRVTTTRYSTAEYIVCVVHNDLIIPQPWLPEDHIIMWKGSSQKLLRYNFIIEYHVHISDVPKWQEGLIILCSPSRDRAGKPQFVRHALTDQLWMFATRVHQNPSFSLFRSMCHCCAHHGCEHAGNVRPCRIMNQHRFPHTRGVLSRGDLRNLTSNWHQSRRRLPPCKSRMNPPSLVLNMLRRQLYLRSCFLTLCHRYD